MSTDRGKGSTTRKAAPQSSTSKSGSQTPSRATPSSKQHQPATPPQLENEPTLREMDERKPAAKRSNPSQNPSPSSPDDPSRPRQVIAVSASKGPTAFFNLARKFLVTDELCDLSALEGAIVSAVDAAHLLERSKLATIVRVQTSYVTVEPKKRKQIPGSPLEHSSSPSVQIPGSPLFPQSGDSSSPPSGRRSSPGRELRRARIVITVKRTDSYKQWLDENPVQALSAGGDDDDEVVGADDQGDPAPL